MAYVVATLLWTNVEVLWLLRWCLPKKYLLQTMGSSVGNDVSPSFITSSIRQKVQSFYYHQK